MKTTKDFNLKASEIKKAERFAANKSSEPCFLAAWSYSGADDLGWAEPHITLQGLEYLQENSLMKKAAAFAKGVKEIVPGI